MDENNKFAINGDVDHLQIIVDPSAGIDRNLYFITSFAVMAADKTSVITGCEWFSNEATDEPLVSLIVTHIKKCRESSEFIERAEVHLIIDSLIPSIVRDIQKKLTSVKGFYSCVFFTPMGDKRRDGIEDLKNAMKEKKLAFYSNFISVSHIDVNTEFKRQLNGYIGYKTQQNSDCINALILGFTESQVLV